MKAIQANCYESKTAIFVDFIQICDRIKIVQI